KSYRVMPAADSGAGMPRVAYDHQPENLSLVCRRSCPAGAPDESPGRRAPETFSPTCSRSQTDGPATFLTTPAFGSASEAGRLTSTSLASCLGTARFATRVQRVFLVEVTSQRSVWSSQAPR